MANADPNSSTTAPPAADAIAQQAAIERAMLVSFVLAWLGATISLLLTRATPDSHGLLCPVKSGCEAVLSSRYGAVLGVRLPLLGITFYGVVMVLVATAYGAATHRLRVRCIGAGFRLAVVGASFSAVLMFIQFVVLRAFCPLCTLSAVVSGCLAIVLAKAERIVAKADFPGRRAGALALAAVALISAVPQLLSTASPKTGVLATVDGQIFTRAQMEEELGAEHEALQRSAFKLESKWVRGKVEGALLAAEARDRKTGVADLLLARMKAIEPPSDAEVDARLASSGVPRSPEAVGRIAAELLSEKREAARARYLEELAGRHRVAVFLEQPAVRALAIDLTTAKVSGPRDAKVQLTVFSDFECRHCAGMAAVLQQVRKDFPDSVMVAYRYFPIESHPRAFAAAVAAECAAEQGVFWQYHDKLYEPGADLSDRGLLAMAAALGLDQTRFAQCQKSASAQAVVEASRADADATGLEGVPALFLNGKRMSGAFTFEQLSQRIRDALHSTASGGNATTDEVPAGGTDRKEQK